MQGLDGQQVPFLHRRQVRISVNAREQSGMTRTYDDVIKTIPDDSIVRFSFVPELDDQFIKFRVSFWLRHVLHQCARFLVIDDMAYD